MRIIYILSFLFILSLSNLSNASPFDINMNFLKDGKINNQKIVDGDIAINDYVSFKTLPRSAPTNLRNYWPQGKVYYQFSWQINDYEKSLVRNALEVLKTSSRANISFTEVNQNNASNYNYINIIKDDGCYSSVGKQQPGQSLSLGNGCWNQGTIIHEFVHALGMHHEQKRKDRDQFIKINWYNMNSMFWGQFNIDDIENGRSNTEYGEYDYDSIMHYDSFAFSNNGSPTIEPVRPGVLISRLNRKDNLSELDKRALQIAYGAVNPNPNPIFNGCLVDDLFISAKSNDEYAFVEYIAENVPTALSFQSTQNNKLDLSSYVNFWIINDYPKQISAKTMIPYPDDNAYRKNVVKVIGSSGQPVAIIPSTFSYTPDGKMRAIFAYSRRVNPNLIVDQKGLAARYEFNIYPNNNWTKKSTKNICLLLSN